MDAVSPSRDQVLEYCARAPIERVFLEDVARRGLGRFSALEAADGTLGSLCLVGTNLVPSGPDCAAFRGVVAGSRARMIIGEEAAVGALWEAARDVLPPPRADRPGQPVYATSVAPRGRVSTALRPASTRDLDVLLPACAAAHQLELGLDPLAHDPELFRERTVAQIDAGRSWAWIEDGVVLFKAEASAWTPHAVQLQQVWVDPQARGLGHGARGLADLIGLLLRDTPVVTLFVRSENAAAIALYEAVGMRHVLDYRSVLF